jgi:ferredoxin
VHVEKAPQAFDIDMLRCIYCGLCQEVCPEEAILLQNQYSMSGYTRAEMVNHKDKLYELGGTLPTAATYINPAETGASIYPLWWGAPTPTSDAGFTTGRDPRTDKLWNYSTSYGGGCVWRITPSYSGS